MAPAPIVIVQYDPRWPAMFERESERIQAALGDRALAIQHIGSTAVAGLAAKPIIDILVGVRHTADLDGCIGPLTRFGYIYDTFPEFPDRRFFRDGPMGAGPHHVHCARYRSDFWEDKVLFRDWLRTGPEAANEYLMLKLDLAGRFGQDRESHERYTDGKNAFIHGALVEARRLLRRR